MAKNLITDEQIILLRDAYEKTLGTPDYLKYSCAWYFKSSKTGEWKFAIWGSPWHFTSGYFKKVRGETYIYSMDGKDRVQLNEACKKLLKIA